MPEKQLTLTDLADENKKFSDILTKHTNARGYLWRLATGEEPIDATELTIGPMFPYKAGQLADDPPATRIGLFELPQETIELILSALLDHEEQLAFQMWQLLDENIKKAKEIMAKVVAQREAALKAQEAAAEDEEFVLPPLQFPDDEDDSRPVMGNTD